MCGTTRLQDAECAIAMGIDALGFIFVKKSPRCVSRERVAAIIEILPPFVTRVGVFVDASIDEIKDVVSRCGLTQVQLHGTESPQFCAELKHWNRGCLICKAFRIGDGHVPGTIRSYDTAIDAILLDSYVKGIEGGTGATFDWGLVNTLELTRPLILAGGLNPDNVAAAIRAVSPYAIDINSGVETAPGIKDQQLIRALVEQVRKVE